MKKDQFLKRMIKNNLNEISIHDIKFIIEKFGAAAADRVLKVIYYINKKRGLILVDHYSTYTKFSSNYYNNTNGYKFNKNIGLYIRYR